MSKPLRLLFTAFAFTVLMAALSFWTAPRLLAQIRAALVQDADNPGRVPYQASVGGTTAANCSAFNCSFVFAPVPAGHRVVVEHVSMFIQPKPNSVPAGVTLAAKSGTTIIDNAAFFATVQSNSDIRLDQPVLAYFDAGESPAVGINVAVDTTLPNSNQVVYLNGYMLDCQAGPCSAIVRH